MQNLVTMSMSEAQLNALDVTLTELETQLAGLVALPEGAKRRYAQLGERSEAFCRQALRVMAENPQLIPPQMDVGEAVRELNLRDALRVRAVRLSKLMSRLQDTDFALGSDAMQVASQGYSLLKVIGRAQGLNEARKNLGTRFGRGRRTKASERTAA
jgi:hypothetical protein